MYVAGSHVAESRVGRRVLHGLEHVAYVYI